MKRITETAAGQEFLQWFGLLAAPLAWTVQLVMGFGAGLAGCSAGSTRWGVGVDTWQISLAVAAGVVVVLAEICSVTLYLATQDVDYDDPPPVGRRHFFVAASSLGNVLFLAMIVMSALAAVYHPACRQS